MEVPPQFQVGGGAQQAQTSNPYQPQQAKWGGGNNNTSNAYRPNAQQGFVPQHVKHGNFFYAQAQNEMQQASTSSSNANGELTDLIKVMIDKFNKLETSHSNLQSLVSQMANAKNEEEGKKGGLPSNIVVNPKGVKAMDLRGGVQVNSIPYYDEEEDEPQECQEAISSG